MPATAITPAGPVTATSAAVSAAGSIGPLNVTRTLSKVPAAVPAKYEFVTRSPAAPGDGGGGTTGGTAGGAVGAAPSIRAPSRLPPVSVRPASAGSGPTDAVSRSI